MKKEKSVKKDELKKFGKELLKKDRKEDDKKYMKKKGKGK